MALENSWILPTLNEDILFEIFKLLSSRDRNNAKLVCKRWFEVSNYKKLTELDAYYFSSFHSLSLVTKVLRNCKRKMFNLKFDHRRFHSSSDSLWKKVGSRIESLRFYKCMFCPGMMQQIFIHCVNLKALYVYDCQPSEFCFLKENFRKKSIFHMKNNILRENLSTLELQSQCIHLKENDLFFIANTFPGLCRLKFNLTADFKDDNVSRNFYTLLRLLDDKLSSVKVLHVEFPNDFKGPVDYSSLRKYNLSSLKNVRTTLYPNVGNLDSIFQYKFWTAFRINWMFHPAVDMTVLVPLLHENPLLEEMTFSWRLGPTNASEFSKIFTALVRSRLKCLYVDLDDVDWSLTSSEDLVGEIKSSLENLTNNHTVHTLHINVTKSVEFSSLFVKYFPNTRDLLIKPWNPQVVFSCQPNLKSIEIAKSIHHSTSKNISPKILVESLQFINIPGLESNVFFKYQFPNLKFLRINESDFYLSRKYKNDEGMLRALDLSHCKAEDKRKDTDVFVGFISYLMPCIARECPRLEGIEFNCRGASFNKDAFTKFFQSCQHFPYLRHVSLICDFPYLVKKEDLKRLIIEYFEQNPSVRTVRLKFENFRLYYFFNVITRKLQFFDQYSNLLPYHKIECCKFKVLWCNGR